MYDCYENFYEPSANDIVMAEIGDIFKKMIRKEIMDELEALRKENAELQEFKRDREFYELKLAAIKSEYESKLRDSERAIKKARIHEVFGDELTVGYMVAKNGKRKPKCDKCDDRRRLYYKTPRGHDNYEVCECSEYDYTYEVRETELVKFCIRNGCWDDQESIYTYYRHVLDSYDDKYDDNVYSLVSQLYDGDSFDAVKSSWNSTVFLSKEKCQEYCDWLNQQAVNDSESDNLL